MVMPDHPCTRALDSTTVTVSLQSHTAPCLLPLSSPPPPPPPSQSTLLPSFLSLLPPPLVQSSLSAALANAADRFNGRNSTMESVDLLNSSRAALPPSSLSRLQRDCSKREGGCPTLDANVLTDFDTFFSNRSGGPTGSNSFMGGVSRLSLSPKCNGLE